MAALAHRLGVNPAQFVVLLATLALGVYAASFWLGDPALPRIVIWFAGAAVVHDLVLFPLYSALDRTLVAAGRGRVPLVNHVRVPALGAGIALLMFWPGIVRQGEATHLAASGLDQSPYLGRWLALTAVLFGASALLYLGRVAVGRGHGTVPSRTEPGPGARLGAGSAGNGTAGTGRARTGPRQTVRPRGAARQAETGPDETEQDETGRTGWKQVRSGPVGPTPSRPPRAPAWPWWAVAGGLLGASAALYGLWVAVDRTRRRARGA